MLFSYSGISAIDRKFQALIPMKNQYIQRPWPHPDIDEHRLSEEDGKVMLDVSIVRATLAKLMH